MPVLEVPLLGVGQGARHPGKDGGGGCGPPCSKLDPKGLGRAPLAVKERCVPGQW